MSTHKVTPGGCEGALGHDGRTGGISRLQSFDDLQTSDFAATQVVPTAGHPYRMLRTAVAFTSEHSAVTAEDHAQTQWSMRRPARRCDLPVCSAISTSPRWISS